MSHLANDDYWEKMFEKYGDEYLDWCIANDLMAGLNDFTVWCEDRDLVAEPIYD